MGAWTRERKRFTRAATAARASVDVLESKGNSGVAFAIDDLWFG